MPKPFQTVIHKEGNVRLLEPMKLPGPQCGIITIQEKLKLTGAVLRSAP